MMAPPLETFAEPLSPATSSSSASQATSSAGAADATFEPTIDMMVNDFDDEHTLNEEEALAALELHVDPHDEIATLREESEMPIELLLAKYRSMPAMSQATVAEPPRKKLKNNKKTKAKRTDEVVKEDEGLEVKGQQLRLIAESRAAEVFNGNQEEDVIVIESGDEEVEIDAGGTEAATELNGAPPTDLDNHVPLTAKATTNSCTRPLEKLKSRRSHLFDLYPGEYSSAVTSAAVVASGAAGKEEEDDDDDEEDDEAEDDDADTDYVKKTIMVGSAYQAVIPDGLSQYGDVLPYENEDKLVWEPRQVGEREVEQFLLNSRDIKPTVSDELMVSSSCDEAILRAPPTNEILNVSAKESFDSIPAEDSLTQLQSSEKKAFVCDGDNELGGVVKDNEQALHLLVQCGYDFKEALRRKRLNAVPLTGSMSLWSEEECHKFEEGIQKFGKDFLKIRQNQVRTRTMRELVQFYYLWKKSERRDNDFANSDTVDHMEIYLNEGGDYGSNANNSTATSATVLATAVTATTAPAFGTRKACAQKNISIMTGSNVASSSTSSAANASQSSGVGAGTKSTAANRKRISGSGAAGGNNFNSDNQSAASAATAHSAK